MTVGELAEPFDMSLAAISKHLLVLERADLIQRRRLGRRTVCALTGDALQTAAEVIAHYRLFWEQRLSARRSSR